MDIEIPKDVKEYITKVFKECNDAVTSKLSTFPPTWETSLDLSAIEHFSNYSAPIKLESNWLVRIDTHYLGGMRHWRNWEIADIGILVIFRHKGKTIKSKIALLQSKRLYANELKYEEDQQENYLIGFGRLFEEDENFLEVIRPRNLSFAEKSKYSALKNGDEQQRAIVEYQKEYGIIIYHLFYNPITIPYSIELPLSERPNFKTNNVGCRIVKSSDVFHAISSNDKGYSPTYGDLKYLLDSPYDSDENTAGWKLESFVADLLIQCKEGYIAKDKNDRGIFAVFNRRSGPIAAAVSITFELD